MSRRAPDDRHERGAALVWAIMLMIIVAGLVMSFVMISQRAGERSGDAARRVANAATVQTAVTRVLYGFQSGLGSEHDYYRLDRRDLAQIVGASGNVARVRTVDELRNLPRDYRLTYGVWEHAIVGGGRGRHQLVPTAAVVPSDVVEETFTADVRACRAAGLPAASCQSGSVRAYWQIVRVIMPDITGEDSPSVVLTIRSWLGSNQTGSWSRASYARVEMRPGRFADFQMIADGNARFGDGAVIDGPVHSNGFASGSFSTVHEAPGASRTKGWVYLDRGVDCSGSPMLTISEGSIYGPGLSRDCNPQGENGQTISFLSVIESMESIRSGPRMQRPNVGSIVTPARRGGSPAGRDPYDTAWGVVLRGTSMDVYYPDGTYRGPILLGRVNAYVFDDDVKVRGTVAADRRLTIAAQRFDGVSASVYINGDIRKGDDRSTAIGLIAQGEVVLWQTPSAPCLVTRVEAAMVAAVGGVTIPRRYTTDVVQADAPVCNRTIRLKGAIAGHRPPTLVWSWPQNDTGGPYYTGYRRDRVYSWDQALQRNPPPYFPLTGSWQPFNIREANSDCLFVPEQQLDPRCR